MKKFFLLVLIAGSVLTGCSDGDSNRSTTYYMHKANYNPAEGTVTVTELESGALAFKIDLENTQEGVMHPAHLHFGDISEVGQLAYTLNSVDGSTGESYTELDHAILSDGDTLTYDKFLTMDASIKVHMNDSYYKYMVLCFGNVGANLDAVYSGVSICTCTPEDVVSDISESVAE